MDKNLSSSQAADRLFGVIEAVAEAGSLGISELARLINLPKSTVFRLVNSLAAKNYLEKGEGDKYALGYRFVAVAGEYMNRLDIRTAALPHLYELAKAVGNTVHMAVRQKDMAVYIEKIEPYGGGCAYSVIGKSIDLYCSALGKSLILGLTEEEFQAYVKHIKRVRFTPTTPTKAALVVEILLARAERITRDNAEHEEGVYCIAAPVNDYKGEVIAAVSISTNEISTLHNQQFIAALKNCAAAVSRQFGFKV